MAKISTINGRMVDQDTKAYQGLCQILYNNELSPNQKISYKDLAARLDVSTTPVIHALKWLELKGVVRREPNKGYFINTISLREVEEIFDARIAIEMSLVEKTVQNLDAEGLERLENALAQYERAVADNDISRRVMTDLRFHMTLASLSKTSIQVNLLEDLFDRLLLKYSQELFSASIIETSPSEHFRIIEAARERSLTGLTEALSEHLSITKTRILKSLSRVLDQNSKAPATYHSFEDIKNEAL
jgi:DNA-binding GntR family transcriptional regulator